MAQGLGIPINVALYEMSFANIQLYTSSLPTYHSSKDDEQELQAPTINASDPANREQVDEILSI